MVPSPTTEACQGRQALQAAQAHAAANEAAAHLDSDIQLGLRHFTDSFLDAISGDFLAEADDRSLRDKYRNEPAALRHHLLRNSRALAAQRALHSLYNKFLAGTAISAEERALAEHAHDLCQTYADHESSSRALRTP